jgi:hypothetical protein
MRRAAHGRDRRAGGHLTAAAWGLGGFSCFAVFALPLVRGSSGHAGDGWFTDLGCEGDSIDRSFTVLEK